MDALADREIQTPTSLEQLSGPTSGVVTLPIHIDWTAANGYEIDDPSELRSMYATVLREARSSSDLSRWLNGALLVREWARLNLPEYVRTAWESTFPALRA